MNEPILLRKGDVIRLPAGQKVYAWAPEWVLYDNSQSQKLTWGLVELDERYSLVLDPQEVKQELVKAIEKVLRKNNLPVHYGKLEEMVSPCLPTRKETVYCVPAGEFEVVETRMQGGGYAMGNDYYPDGHYVTCRRHPVRLGGTEERVAFYQTGAFTAMLREVELVNGTGEK